LGLTKKFGFGLHPRALCVLCPFILLVLLLLLFFSTTLVSQNAQGVSLDFEITPTLEMSRLLEMAGLKGIAASGVLRGTLRIQGRPDDLNFTGHMHGDNVTLDGYARTKVDAEFSAEWFKKSGRVLLRSFEIRSTSGDIRGKGDVYFDSKTALSSIQATLRNFNLQPLSKRFSGTVALASRAGGDVSLQWRGKFNPDDFSGDARLRLTATRSTAAEGVLPIAGPADLHFRSGNTSIRFSSVSSMGALLDGQFSLSSSKAIQGDVDGTVANFELLATQLSRFLAKKEPSKPGLNGSFKFKSRITGNLDQPRLITAIDSTDLQMGNWKGIAVHADTEFNQSRLSFTGTAAPAREANLNFRGNILLSGSTPVLDLNLDSGRVPLAVVLASTGVNVPAEGTLNASLQLGGSLDKLSGTGSIDGQGLVICREPMGSMHADIRIFNNRIEIPILRVAKNRSEGLIVAEAAYNVDSHEFSFRGSGSNWHFQNLELQEKTLVRGFVNFTASGSGTIEQPVFSAELSSKGAELRGINLGSFTAKAELKGGIVTADAAFSRFQLTTNLRIGTHAPYRTDLRVQASQLDVGLLGFKGAAGTMDLQLAGTGNLADPLQAEASALIQSASVHFGGVPIEIREPIKIDFRNGLIQIPGAAFVSGQSILRIAGSVPVLKKAPMGELRAQAQIDIEEAVKLAGNPRGISGSGRADFDLKIWGNLESLDAAGTIGLENGHIGYPGIPAFSDIFLRSKLENGLISLQEAKARWGSGNVKLSAELPLGMILKRFSIDAFRQQTQKPASFNLQLANLELQSIKKFTEDVNGLVSLQASGSAGSLDLRSVAADIKFDELKLNLGQVTIQQSGQSSISVKDGRAFIRQLEFVGPETNLVASGSAGLEGNSNLDLQLQGTTQAGLLGPLVPDLKFAGPVQMLAALYGLPSAPHVSGYLEIKEGQVAMESPRVSLDGLNARFDFVDNRITVANFKGTLNGGSIAVTGSADLKKALGGMNLAVRLRDVFLEFPYGLRSFSTADLTLTSSDSSITVAGKARAIESSYRESLEIGSGILKLFRPRLEEIEKERSRLLSLLRFNVAIETAAPLMVKNNLADLEADANLKLVGTFYSPSMVGKIDLEEGGQIILNQRNYFVRRGVINLINQSELEPDLDIQAETTISGYTITMQINGTPERLTTQLSSESSLSQTDIASLLVTGSPKKEQLSTKDYQLGQASQAFSLLAGQAGQEVTRGARGLLGLSTVRIEPSFIASEANPGARLTLGQDLTRNLRVGYSMNLVNGGDQIWLAEYNIRRKFTAQGTKQEDNSYRLGFTHDLRIGVAPGEAKSASSAKKPKIGEVKFQIGQPLSGKDLKEKFNLKPGDPYDFPKIEKGLNRIQKNYFDQDLLEARVKLQRERKKGIVNLTINIDPGPEVSIIYEGMHISQKTREQVRRIWEGGVFDTARINESIQAIRRSLVEEGYLQANVDCKTEAQPGAKTVRFKIDPGARYSNVGVEFPGASAVNSAQLREALKSAGLSLDIYLDSRKVTDFLQNYYHRRSYLGVVVSSPVMQLDSHTATGKVLIPVREGPLFTIGDLNFEGNRAFDYFELWSLIPISTGSIYSADLVQESVDILERFYRSRGYNEAGIAYRIDPAPKSAQASITLQISENKQSIIKEISIEGNRLTGAGVVQRILTFKKGDVLDFTEINNTRRKIYETGLYSFVDFETEDLPDSGLKKNVHVRINLRELSTYRLNYGGYFDTERGPGGIADLTRQSPFGQASSVGLRLRYDSDLKVARLYYSQPHINGLILKTDATFLAQQETRPGFYARRVGMSLFQQKNLPDKFVLDYGYRYDHVHWTGTPEDPTLFLSNVPVARITGTLWRDTRDSILNATTGEFMSHAFEYGPTWLGSRIGFFKYSGQYFRYVGLDKFFRISDEKGKTATTPPRLIYAGAIRVGITKAFGGDSVISPERFYAGGGTTMRGFGQDLLGPVTLGSDGNLKPLGGEALFLLNNEIRFPIVGFLGGASFLDVGNVFSSVSDFSLRDLRKSAGAGLRVNVRYLLLRFDYGWKLDRRPGESRGEFFFSIGQAF
jgi:outer membrane protein assembly complex protein YaeT